MYLPNCPLTTAPNKTPAICAVFIQVGTYAKSHINAHWKRYHKEKREKINQEFLNYFRRQKRSYFLRFLVIFAKVNGLGNIKTMEHESLFCKIKVFFEHESLFR